MDSFLTNEATRHHQILSQTMMSSHCGNPVAGFLLGFWVPSWHRAPVQETVQVLRNPLWRPCTLTWWQDVAELVGKPCGEMWMVSAKHQAFRRQTALKQWQDNTSNQGHPTVVYWLFLTCSGSLHTADNAKKIKRLKSETSVKPLQTLSHWFGKDPSECSSHFI